MTAGAPAAPQLLRFIYEQSYGKEVDGGESDHPASYWSPPEAHRFRLPGGLDPAADPAAGPPDRAGSAGPRWVDALRHLVVAGQVLRREPSNPHNDHRSYPSAACRFGTHLWLAAGSSPQLWHYHPIEHAIEAGSGPPPGLAERCDGYRIAVACDYFVFDRGYRSLRYPLAMLEAGHCLYNLAATAAALGFEYRVRLWFDDAGLLAAAGVPAGGGWLPAAVLEVGQDQPTGWPDPASRPAAAAATEPDEVAAADRLGWCRGEPEPLPAGRLEVPPGQRRDLPALAAVLAERNSGRGMLGVTGQAGPLPGEVLAAAGRALATAAGPQPPVSPAALRWFAAVQAIEGYADGLYELDPAGQPRLIRPGREVFGQLQAAYSYPPSVMTIESFHLVFLAAVDYPRVVGELGPRGFRVSQLQLGWVAQATGLVLAGHDCFCRPARAYSEWQLANLLGLRAEEVVAYQLLCSRNHLRDLAFDLRIREVDR